MSIIQNDHSEGPVAKAIEKQTAKLPSDIFYGQLLDQWRHLQH